MEKIIKRFQQIVVMFFESIQNFYMEGKYGTNLCKNDMGKSKSPIYHLQSA